VAWRLIQRGAKGEAREPGQHTGRNALIAGMLLFLLIVVTAWSCSESTTQPLLDRYIRLGPRQGAAELERDLSRDFPAGTGIGPLFETLDRQGFDCAAALQPGAGGACRFRTRHEGNRVALIEVAVGHDGLLLQSVAVRMSVGPP
jgi:hypothetical protein